MKKYLLLLALPILAMCAASCNKDNAGDSEIIQFKDPNFLKELLVVKDIHAFNPKDEDNEVLIHQDIDKNKDGQISIGEAKQVTHLELVGDEDDENGYNLTDINEIRYFTELKYLMCFFSKITSLDVSKNTKLECLGCFDHKLTSLDVSNNKSLICLSCDNPCGFGGSVDEEPTVTYEGQLAALNVSGCTALTVLVCSGNPLTTLDVSKNIALKSLDCNNNQLTSLDLSNNTALEDLSCHANQLSSLDISKNTALKMFDCSGNKLTTLDLRKNTILENLNCIWNPLTKITLYRNHIIDESDILTLENKYGDIIELVD